MMVHRCTIVGRTEVPECRNGAGSPDPGDGAVARSAKPGYDPKRRTNVRIINGERFRLALVCGLEFL